MGKPFLPEIEGEAKEIASKIWLDLRNVNFFQTLVKNGKEIPPKRILDGMTSATGRLKGLINLVLGTDLSLVYNPPFLTRTYILEQYQPAVHGYSEPKLCTFRDINPNETLDLKLLMVSNYDNLGQESRGVFIGDDKSFELISLDGLVGFATEYTENPLNIVNGLTTN